MVGNCEQGFGAGAYPGFVGPEDYTIFEALFKKTNTKLFIEYFVRKWIYTPI
jgi:hypothetical protein